MSTIKDGGPAFPVSWSIDGEIVAVPGMTLRDFFAAKAMQGDWSAQAEGLGYFSHETNDKVLASAAELYYRMADAMLAAREVQS